MRPSSLAAGFNEAEAIKPRNPPDDLMARIRIIASMRPRQSSLGISIPRHEHVERDLLQ